MIDINPIKGPLTHVVITEAQPTTEAVSRAVTRFLSLFLSDYDTVTAKGAGFISYLQNRGVITSATIASQVAISGLIAIQQMGDQSGLEPAAILKTVSLVDINYAATKATVTVRLHTDAGTYIVAFDVGTIA